MCTLAAGLDGREMAKISGHQGKIGFGVAATMGVAGDSAAWEESSKIETEGAEGRKQEWVKGV